MSSFIRRKCWGDDPVFRIPIVCDIMPVDLFMAVQSYCHFETEDNRNDFDSSWKYRRAVDLLKQVNQKNYQMGQDIAPDEGVCDTSSKKVCSSPKATYNIMDSSPS